MRAFSLKSSTVLQAGLLLSLQGWGVLATAAPPARPVAPAKATVNPAVKPASQTAVAGAPLTAEVAAIVAKVQARYDQTLDLRARFSQELLTAATGRKRLHTGEVLMKKPGRMRMNYENPEKQMYLSNGQVMWFFEPEAKQAFKQDPKAAQLPAAFSFLMGKGKLAEEFEIQLGKELPYGAPTDIKLSLRPRQIQSTYKFIYFVVDPATSLVKQTVLVTSGGDINSIAFSDVKTNTKLADQAFNWTPPAGTKIVDTGKLGK